MNRLKPKQRIISIWTLFVGSLGLLFLPHSLTWSKEEAKPSERKPQIVHMKIDGSIHYGTAAIVELGINRVKAIDAEALFITMDTPGGLLDSTREIVKKFLNTDVPIIVYVAPRGAHAGSAGTFITMAAHIAAMAPGTNIGAATPISATGKDPEQSGGEKLARKLENDTIAFIEGIARQRNRNAEWAKKAVTEAASISEEEAVKINVIDFVADDAAEVLKKAHGKTIELPKEKRTLNTQNGQLIELELDLFTEFKNFLANPTVMFFLLMIAGLGIYIEMSNPGLIFPGVAGALAIVLLMIATSAIPITFIGVGLIILGFGLLFAEIYISSFGLLAIGGVVSFAIGAFLLFDPEKTDLRVPWELIVGTSVGLGLIGGFIAYMAGKTFNAKQLTGSEGMVGRIVTVEKEISPDQNGKIFAAGTLWNASANTILKKGQKARIEKMEGLLAHVTEANEGEQENETQS